MKYYTVQNNNIAISENEETLKLYYDNVYELPEDYEDDKYIIGEVEEEIDVPDYETVTEEYEDENGEIQTNEVQKPVMIEVEETIIVPIYDEETGEQTGEEELTITKLIPKTHKETITVQKLVPNPDWETIKEQKERERLDSLTLTPADVERALYKEKQMDFEDLKALIAERLPQVDIKGLSIEFRAKDFFRGAEANGMRLFDVVGQLLGYTPKDIDYLFEHKELPVNEEEENEN